MSMTVLLDPVSGVKPVIVWGCMLKVKPFLVAKLVGVVTLTTPEAPAPTTALMVVGDTTIKELAAMPPKLTPVTPVKLVPVILTAVPVAPLVGVKELMVRSFAFLLISTEMEAVPLLTTDRSGRPSPSMSAPVSQYAWGLAR